MSMETNRIVLDVKYKAINYRAFITVGSIDPPTIQTEFQTADHCSQQAPKKFSTFRDLIDWLRVMGVMFTHSTCMSLLPSEDDLD